MVVGNKMTNEEVEIFAPFFIKRDKGLKEVVLGLAFVVFGPIFIIIITCKCK